MTAVLGLAIEPLAQIQAQVAVLPSAVARPAPNSFEPTLLAERIVKHLFNYISGFVGGSGGVSPELAVPMSIIARWYEIFIAKVKAGGVGFLERSD